MDSDDSNTHRLVKKRAPEPQERLMILTHKLTEETTAHGIPHIARANGFWRSLIWILISLTMVATWIYHSQYTITQYLKSEVNVKLTFQSAQNLPFPAVTICNKNAFRKRASEAWMGSMMFHMGRPEGRNLTFPPWMGAFAEMMASANTTDGNLGIQGNPSQLGEDLVQMETDTIIKFGARYNITFDMLTHSYQDFVMGCSYERETCDKRGIKVRKIFNWLHGNCYVVNAEKDILRSTQTGPRYGLRLTLNIEQDDYMDVVDQAGAKVLVHDPEEMPFPEDDGYNIPPGLAASIGIKLIKRNRLGGPYSSCFDEAKQSQIHDIFRASNGWTKYALKTCMLSCYQRELESRCGCSDVRYPKYDKEADHLVSCTENMTFTYTPEFKVFDPNECPKIVQEMYRNQTLNCEKECQVPCSQNAYYSAVSYAVWPAKNAEFTVVTNAMKTPSAARLLNQSKANIFKNFLEVTVYYEDFSYNDISERAAIRLTECLSDLGGNMGMYIGASLFTFFEFFQFVFDFLLWSCVWVCKYINRGRNGSQSAFQRIFSASKNKVHKIDVKPQSF